MATFFVGGFTWEASQPSPGRPMVTREEALDALDRLGTTARYTIHYRQAKAALSVADYGQVQRCCWAAEEVGSDERWT